MDKLRAQFEADSVHAPYFPLARFGKYFVYSTQGGEPYYDMFENIGEWNRHKRDVMGGGGQILGAGKILEQDYSKLEVDPEFVGQVDQLVASLGTHEKVTEIRDEIYQLYLQALLELSSRKHAIHRSKIRGFYLDHLRAFANTAQHGSNMLGRLKYGHKMQATLDEAKKALGMAQYPSEYANIEEELENLREYLSEDIGEMTNKEIRHEIKKARDAEDDDLLRKWQYMSETKRNTEQIRSEPGQATPYLPDVIQKRIDRRVKLLDMADNIIKYDKARTDDGGSMTEHVLDEIGKTEPITSGIIVNQGRVEQVRVLIFRESRGSEVHRSAFTRQYENASLESDNSLDLYIDGITGATMSVSALNRQVKLALLLDKVTREKNDDR